MVDVIIVNHNSADLVLDSVRSMLAYGAPRRIVIVDSGSRPEHLVRLQAVVPASGLECPVKIVEMVANVGFGRASNAGFAHTTAEYVLLLNPDTVFRNDAIGACVEILDMQPDVGAVGCKLLNRDGSLQHSWYRLPTLRSLFSEYFLRRWRPFPGDLPREPRDVEGISGAFMLLRCCAVEEVGLFDDRFFMYVEEVDLCKRLRDAAWRIVYAPIGEVIHYGGATVLGEGGRAWSFLELQRSRLRYVDKHFSGLARRVARGIIKVGIVVDGAVQILKAATGRLPWREAVQRVAVYGAVWRS